MNRQRIADDRRAAVRRGAQPHDLRSQQHEPVVGVAGLVIQRNTDPHHFSKISINTTAGNSTTPHPAASRRPYPARGSAAGQGSSFVPNREPLKHNRPLPLRESSDLFEGRVSGPRRAEIPSRLQCSQVESEAPGRWLSRKAWTSSERNTFLLFVKTTEFIGLNSLSGWPSRSAALAKEASRMTVSSQDSTADPMALIHPGAGAPRERPPATRSSSRRSRQSRSGGLTRRSHECG